MINILKILMISFALNVAYVSYGLPINKLHCPNVVVIKSQRLIRAEQNIFDHEQWNLVSTQFNHENLLWQVTYGSFFAGNLSEGIVLQLGQLQFQSVVPVIQNPEPYYLANGIILCSYMPEGRSFWLDATTKRI